MKWVQENCEMGSGMSDPPSLPASRALAAVSEPLSLPEVVEFSSQRCFQFQRPANANLGRYLGSEPAGGTSLYFK